jgi:hypothetical protein
MFQFYFEGQTGNFVIENNSTTVLTMENAYEASFIEEWVYIAVNFASLYTPTDANDYELYYLHLSKTCVYILGSGIEK